MAQQLPPDKHDPADLTRTIETLQTENAQLKKQLAEVTRSSSQYLQNVAHQLTAPLNAIKWSIEALDRPEVPLARKKNLLSSIYAQGTILVHLIKNFALMSNLEADLELGQLVTDKPDKLDVLRVAINLANDFQPQAAEGGKTISVDDLSFQEGLRGKSVLAVRMLIAQALSNLLENAVKYSDLRTTITIAGVRVPFKELPDGFGLRVTSVGIPLFPKEIDRLQQRGFRGAAARAKVPAGTGIGLYLAERIMELHQGTILATGRGKEASFTLVFPPSRLV